MILTKSKIFAATLVACGVAASGVGVFGQQGSERQEVDRLGGVEQKLDRLIKILENQNRPPAGMVMPGMGGMSGMGMMPGMAPPGGIPAPGHPPSPPAPPAAEAMTGMMEMMGGGYGQMSTPMKSTAARIDAVEKRLDHLEARLADVERRLNPLPPSRSSSASDEAEPSRPRMPRERPGRDPFDEESGQRSRVPRDQPK